MRFIAVSATVPNAADVATWLGVPRQGLLIYGEEMRPVKLNTVVKGYSRTKTDFLFEKRLNEFIYAVIAEYSQGKPSLVFCRCRLSSVHPRASPIIKLHPYSNLRNM